MKSSFVLGLDVLRVWNDWQKRVYGKKTQRRPLQLIQDSIIPSRCSCRYCFYINGINECGAVTPWRPWPLTSDTQTLIILGFRPSGHSGQSCPPAIPEMSSSHGWHEVSVTFNLREAEWTSAWRRSLSLGWTRRGVRTDPSTACDTIQNQNLSCSVSTHVLLWWWWAGTPDSEPLFLPTTDDEHFDTNRELAGASSNMSSSERHMWGLMSVFVRWPNGGHCRTVSPMSISSFTC